VTLAFASVCRFATQTSFGISTPRPTRVFRGERFASTATAGMREVIAKRIIEMAQQGVKDQHTLVDDAVRFLAANYKDVSEQPA
jgi:hypothetical protein